MEEKNDHTLSYTIHKRPLAKNTVPFWHTQTQSHTHKLRPKELSELTVWGCCCCYTLNANNKTHATPTDLNCTRTKRTDAAEGATLYTRQHEHTRKTRRFASTTDRVSSTFERGRNDQHAANPRAVRAA